MSLDPPATRRDLLRLLAGATALACTPRGDDAPPAPQWPDGPAPELVLAIDGDSSVTWYADGLVLCERSPGVMMWGSEEMKRSPELLLTRVDVIELARLRALVGADEVQRARSDYIQPRIRDGTHLLVIAGARRIHIGNDPPDLPAALAKLKHAYHALLGRPDAVDAFVAPGPRLVALHTRTFRSRRFSDRLAVFANGVLDYRVTAGDTVTLPDGESPYPTVTIEQVPRDTLAPLRERLAELDRRDIPAHPQKLGDDATSGTSQVLMHGGRVPRIRTRPGTDVPEALRPTLAALADLRARWGAPPDEP